MVKAIQTAAAVTIPTGETTWGAVFIANGLQLHYCRTADRSGPDHRGQFSQELCQERKKQRKGCRLTPPISHIVSKTLRMEKSIRRVLVFRNAVQFFRFPIRGAASAYRPLAP